MAGRRPRTGDPARGGGTLVRLAAARAARTGVRSYRAVQVGEAFSHLIVCAGARVYLFPLELTSIAPGLVNSDPEGLAQAGAGVEVTALFGPGRAAALRQALAVYQAKAAAGRTR